MSTVGRNHRNNSPSSAPSLATGSSSSTPLTTPVSGEPPVPFPAQRQRRDSDASYKTASDNVSPILGDNADSGATGNNAPEILDSTGSGAADDTNIAAGNGNTPAGNGNTPTDSGNIPAVVSGTTSNAGTTAGNNTPSIAPWTLEWIKAGFKRLLIQTRTTLRRSNTWTIIVSMFLAILFGLPAWLSLRLSAWTGKKDFYMLCTERIKELKGANLERCQSAIEAGLPPPPMSYFKRNANEAFPPGMHPPRKLLPQKLLPRWPTGTTLNDAEVQLPSGIASELLLVVFAAVLIFMISVIAINSGRRAWKRLQHSQFHTNRWLDREHDHDQTYNGSKDRNILWASGLTIVVITGIALRSFIMLILDIAVAERDYRTFCADQKEPIQEAACRAALKSDTASPRMHVQTWIVLGALASLASLIFLCKRSSWRLSNSFRLNISTSLSSWYHGLTSSSGVQERNTELQIQHQRSMEHQLEAQELSPGPSPEWLSIQSTAHARRPHPRTALDMIEDDEESDATEEGDFFAEEGDFFADDDNDAEAIAYFSDRIVLAAASLSDQIARADASERKDRSRSRPSHDDPRRVSRRSSPSTERTRERLRELIGERNRRVQRYNPNVWSDRQSRLKKREGD